MTRRTIWPWAAVAAVTAIFAVSFTVRDARSQLTKTIRIVVPYAPGGVNDVIARLLGEAIGRAGGPAMVVENRPGAGGQVGTETVARATPDGQTLLIASTPFLIDPLLHSVNFDPMTSFAPVCHLVDAPTVIVVNSASSYRTLADLLDDARAKPGQLTLASIGPGSSFQLGFEALKRAAKADMTFVPYPGNAPALNAVLGQQVTSMFGTYSNVAEYLKAGKLRALAVGNRTRVEALPDVQTIAQSGYPDVETDAWFGAFAPAATPSDVIFQLQGLLPAAMKDAGVKEKLIVQGLDPVEACDGDFAGYLRKQFDEYRRIIAVANIKAE